MRRRPSKLLNEDKKELKGILSKIDDWTPRC
jgi:hypothetical protein